jgi:LmbE family N-acetylglucosaminyl deacetylase
MTDLRRLGFFLVFAVGCGAPEPREPGGPADLLVFAPHPDDETLGCAGILRQALKRGERVRVVVFTHGDGFPASAALHARKPVERLVPEDFKALAAFRQGQSEQALRALGGDPADLVFLGYPDAGLDAVYRTRGPEPYRQRFTGRSETYGAARPDWHGRPAPYTYESVRADVAELIRTLRPRRICVTNEADQHPDHQAAFRFVRDGAEQAGYRGPLDTYLVHGGPEWPWPAGSTPEASLEAHEVQGVRSPRGVPWPPPLRVRLSPDEVRSKEQAVRAQASHLVGSLSRALEEERAYLQSFVKAEEVFWPWERP